MTIGGSAFERGMFTWKCSSRFDDGFSLKPCGMICHAPNSTSSWSSLKEKACSTPNVCGSDKFLNGMWTFQIKRAFYIIEISILFFKIFRPESLLNVWKIMWLMNSGQAYMRKHPAMLRNKYIFAQFFTNLMRRRLSLKDL